MRMDLSSPYQEPSILRIRMHTRKAAWQAYARTLSMDPAQPPWPSQKGFAKTIDKSQKTLRSPFLENPC
jgi:hypothetical protein